MGYSKKSIKKYKLKGGQPNKLSELTQTEVFVRVALSISCGKENRDKFMEWIHQTKSGGVRIINGRREPIMKLQMDGRYVLEMTETSIDKLRFPDDIRSCIPLLNADDEWFQAPQLRDYIKPMINHKDNLPEISPIALPIMNKYELLVKITNDLKFDLETRNKFENIVYILPSFNQLLTWNPETAKQWVVDASERLKYEPRRLYTPINTVGEEDVSKLSAVANYIMQIKDNALTAPKKKLADLTGLEVLVRIAINLKWTKNERHEFEKNQQKKNGNSVSKMNDRSLQEWVNSSNFDESKKQNLKEYIELMKRQEKENLDAIRPMPLSEMTYYEFLVEVSNGLKWPIELRTKLENIPPNESNLMELDEQTISTWIRWNDSAELSIFEKNCVVDYMTWVLEHKRQHPVAVSAVSIADVDNGLLNKPKLTLFQSEEYNECVFYCPITKVFVSALTINVHKSAVRCCIFKPNPNGFVTSSNDNCLIYHYPKDQNIYSKFLIKYNTPVLSLAYYEQLNAIVIGFSDGNIHIQQFEGTKIKKEFNTQTPVYSLAIHPNLRVFACGSINQIQIHNEENRKSIRIQQEGIVRSMCFHPTAEPSILALSCENDDDGAIILEELSTMPNGEFSKRRLHTIKEEAGVLCIAFHPEKRIIAAGFSNNTVKIWKFNDTTILRIQTLTGHSNSVRSLAFHPNKPIFASGSTDGTTIVWSLKFKDEQPVSATCLTILREHSRSVNTIAFDPVTFHLVTGSSDGSIKIWWLE